MSGNYALIWFGALIMVFVSASKYNRAPIWRKIFAVSGLMVVVMIVADGIFDIVQTQPKPAPKIEQSVAKPPTPTPPKIPAEWAALPEKISVLPSIGATREEFDSKYFETDKNHVGYIRYDQDVWHVQYLDGTNNDSDDPKARAYIVTMQVVTGVPFPALDLKDLLPSDAVNITTDNGMSDNVVKVVNIHGTSATLAKIFPKSGGKFSGGFNWDAQTGAFIGGTISPDYEWK